MKEEIKMIEFEILESIRITKLICQKCGNEMELGNLITANMRKGDTIGFCGDCDHPILFGVMEEEDDTKTI